MTRQTGNARPVLRALGLAAILLGLLAPSAVAVPTLGVDLERDAAEFPTVSRSDERVDYTVNVENNASAEIGVGTTVACLGTPADGVDWFGHDPAPTFTYHWVRNGQPIAGATEKTYTVDAADEGKSLQCVVTGTNQAPTFAPISSSAASLPPTVIPPTPTPAPPSGDGRPTSVSLSGKEGAVGNEQLCEAPDSWSGDEISWSFQWLRNGQPIPGATSSTYTIQTADVEPPSLVSCEAIAKDAAGNEAISIRSSARTKPEPTPPYESPAISSANPFVAVANATSGTVTVELELPGGQETYAFKIKTKGTGWTCEKEPASGAQHAKVLCSRSDALSPGGSYPAFKVLTALGADAPDTAVAKATVSGGGAVAPASDEEVFVFGPPTPFGLSTFKAQVLDAEGHDYTQAGGHPFSAVGTLVFNQKRQLNGEENKEILLEEGKLNYKNMRYAPIEHVKQIITDLPRGFSGNPLAVQPCPSVLDVAEKNCPLASQVGGVELDFSGTPPGGMISPISLIKPEFGTPAQFGFIDPFGNIYTLSVRLRPEDGYAASLVLESSPVLDLL
ncbi:MAG TPA: hypothetical protein VN756_01255, partial [Solirubrobacterales bacterium]|nr:hypothetical protein [Solirubrobacterales bacterium]